MPASAIPISKPLIGLRSAFWGRGKFTGIENSINLNKQRR
jgi:hypothetical protein